MKNLIFLSSIFLFLAAFNIAEAQNRPSALPADWKKIEACGIRFYAPSDLKEESVVSDDSCYKRYRNSNIILSLDVIGYKGDSRKDEYSDEKDFKLVKTVIDKRRAEIITYYETENTEQWKDLLYGSVLFIPQMRKDCCNLTLWGNSRTSADRELTKRIFETVRIEK